MKKKLLASILACAMCATLITGCSSSASKSYTFDVETGDRIEVTMDTSGKGYDLSTEDSAFIVSTPDNDEAMTGIFVTTDTWNTYMTLLEEVPHADVKLSGAMGYYWVIDGEDGSHESDFIFMVSENSGVIIGSLMALDDALETVSRLSFEVVSGSEGVDSGLYTGGIEYSPLEMEEASEPVADASTEPTASAASDEPSDATAPPAPAEESSGAKSLEDVDAELAEMFRDLPVGDSPFEDGHYEEGSPIGGHYEAEAVTSDLAVGATLDVYDDGTAVLTLTDSGEEIGLLYDELNFYSTETNAAYMYNASLGGDAILFDYEDGVQYMFELAE